MNHRGVSWFKQHGDGSITVDQWYRDQRFTSAFVVRMRHRGLYWLIDLERPEQPERIEIIVKNGRAVYEMVAWDANTSVFTGRLIEAEIDIESELTPSGGSW